MDTLKSVAAAGSSAVLTVTGIHPIDVVKTRLQISGDGTDGMRNYKSLGVSGTVRVIAAEEGIASFWKGIGAAWLREASYTSLRIGLYGPIKDLMGVTNDSHFLLKFSAGSAAGGIGSVVRTDRRTSVLYPNRWSCVRAIQKGPSLYTIPPLDALSAFLSQLY